MTLRAAAVSLRSYGERETTHAHDWHQLVLPIEGVHVIGVGEAEGRIEAGRGALIASGLAHRYRALGENRFVVLDIPCHGRRAQGLPEGLCRRVAASPFFAIDDALARLAHYLADEMADGPLDAATERHASALVIDAITRRLATSAIPPSIARALERIEADYARPLTVGTLARDAGLSISIFHQRFREAVGQSPGDYLAERRLDHAARLLVASDLSIAEIALLTGFSEQSALTRSFRRRRGTTPARLRRANA
ncbi:MAG: AraC family transcriptional regulator [Alphaproteobacteria bacterium]|mgnify:CR=1 FL=1